MRLVGSLLIVIIVIVVLGAGPLVATAAMDQGTSTGAAGYGQAPTTAPATAPSDNGGSAIEHGMTKAGEATGKALDTAAKAVSKALEKAGDAMHRAGEWTQEKTGE